MKKISHKSEAVLSGLLDYLAEKGERNLLPEVAKSLQEEIIKARKSDKIIVTSVIRLSFPQQRNLKAILQKIIKVNLPIINNIDRNLLGGFTIKINDWFLDASISHQINLLKRSLLAS